MDKLMQTTLGRKELKGDRVFVTTVDGGRLGNLISVLAILYHCQVEFGMTPLLPVRVNYTVCFYFRCDKEEEMATRERYFPKWEREKWVHFPPDREPSFGPGVHFAYVSGHPTNVKLFPKHLKDLREKFLTLKEEYLEHGRNQLRIASDSYRKKHIVNNNDTITYIGVHIRHGDYQTTEAEENYFTRAMNVFRKSERHPLFVVVSEDMNHARRKVIPRDNDCFFLAQGREKEDVEIEYPKKGLRKIYLSTEIGNDFSLLVQTNYSILTYGTFGMWSALLSGANRVILPKEQEDEFINRRIREADIPGWIFL